MADDTNAATLEIRGLHAEVEGKEILRGIDLVVQQDETHALMGQRIGQVDAERGHGTPRLHGDGGRGALPRRERPAATPDQRAQRGLFLAMQYPVEVPGVSVVNFLRTAYQAMKGEQERPGVSQAHEGEDGDARHRGRDGESLRESGILRGEKKRNEILQLAVLEPEIAILDETDSGSTSIR